MIKEEFIEKIEAMGFVKKEPLLTTGWTDIEQYICQNGTYQVMIGFRSDGIKIKLFYYNEEIATFEWLLLNEATISILKNLLRGFDDKVDDEHTYSITFDVEDMIKEARFCGYKINEEQAQNLIDYLNRKGDGVYETIQQYITGYCQNNKFEELKEDGE
jgi:hypothetical protein